MNDDPNEDITRPWDQREGEPEVWYSIFRTYYLPLGPRRSLRRAFELYLRSEKPERYKELDPDGVTKAPQHWNPKSRDWDWPLRARMYDAEQLDVTSAQIEHVLTYLRDNSINAAQALVDALQNPRTQVQAANSILNRSGVPETTEIKINGGTSITSDEMAAAEEKVRQWKSSTNENSESSG